MTTKSIISIDVKDEAFKEFLALFKKYEAMLAEQPSKWEEIGAAISGSSAGFEKAASGLYVSKETLDAMADSQKKISQSQEVNAKQATQVDKSFQSVNKSTKSIREHIEFATSSLFKWVGIGTAFGVGLEFAQRFLGKGMEMGRDVSERYKTAAGLKLTTGQLMAARTVYEPYIQSTEDLLARIYQMKYAPTTESAVAARTLLGPNFQSILSSKQNVFQQLPTFLDAMRKQWEHVQELQQKNPYAAGAYFQQRQLDVLGDTKRYAQIAAKSDADLKSIEDRANKAAKAADMSDYEIKSWQKMLSDMDLGLSLIGNFFKAAAVALTHPLSGRAWKELRDLQNADILGRPTEYTGFRLPEIRQGIWNTDLPQQVVTGKIRGAGQAALPGSSVSPEKTSFGDRASKEAFLSKLETTGEQLPKRILDFLWREESRRGQRMVSPRGAMGDFGFMPGTQQQYGVKNVMNFWETAPIAKQILLDLHKHFKDKDWVKTIAAYNWGEGNLQHYLRGESSYTDKAGVVHNTAREPRETQKYVKDFLAAVYSHRFGSTRTPYMISNAPGADINVQASQLPY